MITDTRETRLELHARSGRAVLVAVEQTRQHEVDPSRLQLPDTLVEALHEWAHVADTITREESGKDASAATLVARRGRQLALRLALETGGEVGCRNPLSGNVDRVGPQRNGRPTQLRRRGRPGLVNAPTPWGTGLTVSGIIAAIVVIALFVVSTGLAEVSVLLAWGVNVAVAAGFAPSIWLGRRVPVWRWVAFGTATGIGLAWLALLLSTLG